MDEEDENREIGGQRDCEHLSDEFDFSVEASEDQPDLTSRLSVKRIVEVFKKFDEYKRWLVSEIGFGGMLNLPLLTKIDLRMSAWVMRKVRVKYRTIVIDDNRVLLFVPEDFHKIFGVPCGNRAVRGRDGHIKSSAVEFIKKTIGMDVSPAHNLKAAEAFLSRDISEESSKIEKDCFQIAVVIFVMGYLLSPCTKYDYMTIDFWGAVANPELISQFNWCEYALDNLMAAVLKVQSEYQEKAQIVHLAGCHLFLQIFVLDNIDLGLCNMTHSVFPRVQCFDQKTLRQMITVAQCMQNGVISFVPASLRHPDSVCYFRVAAVSPVRGDAAVGASSSRSYASKVAEMRSDQSPTVGVQGNTGSLNFMGNPMSANRSVGPSDLSKHLRQICKNDPVLDELSLMLKQHNAKCTLSTTLLRNQLQSDMFCFADKVVALVKGRCRCCAKRGLPKCITLTDIGEDGAERTAVLGGRQLNLSDDEGCSNGKEQDERQNAKRKCAGQSEIKDSGNEQPQNEYVHPVYNNPMLEQHQVDMKKMVSDRVAVYAQTIVEMVRSLYDTDDEGSVGVYFGDTEAKLPSRRYNKSASFCTDPWGRGCIPQPPPICMVDKFNTWLDGANDYDLNSVWFIHMEPRFLRVNAMCVKDQIIGKHALDHEVGTLVLRRFQQIDREVDDVSRYMLWREVLEPDFSTHALAGEEVVHIKAVQCQIAAAKHDITASRMFFVPSILDQGWAVYMWDMMRKEIHVLDPMCCQITGAEQRYMMHEEAVSQTHNALFNCLNEFFAKWHCTGEGWKRRFPKITSDVFTRDESGMCAIHAIRQYDGHKMKWPLTKKNVETFRRSVAYEVFRLCDEHGQFVAENVLRAAFEEAEEG